MSVGLGWRCARLPEDQLGAQPWGYLSSPGYSPEDMVTAGSVSALSKPVLNTET